jgi:photosystem II stability/assembly factor-like uncharacterized protein
MRKQTIRVRSLCCYILIAAAAGWKFEETAFSADSVVTAISFQPSTVRLGGSFSATFAGTNLTDQMYFDIRVQTPDGVEMVMPNWQFGRTAVHTVPFETASGTWKVTGVGAHLDPNDHSQSLVAVSGTLTVSSWTVTGPQFDPVSVASDGSFSANFSGSNLTADTYFDVRFRAPCSDQDLIAVNWQRGTSVSHTIPSGTAPGPWTITGVWAHQDINDHSADFVSVSATLQVGVQNPLAYYGLMVSIAVDPSRSATVYAATAVSGVLKSCDAGQTWIPASTNIPDKMITALALDPSSPGVLYAASHSGVLKSVNGAVTWEVLSSDVAPVHSVAVDPQQPATIYAGTEGHFFKSLDGGHQWTLADWGMPVGVIVQSIAIDPTNPDIVYAGTDVPIGSRAQVFKTTDGGNNWQASWYPATGASGINVQTVNALIVDPKNASTIYAGTLNPDVGPNFNQPGAFKSMDGGKSWTGLAGITGPDHRYLRSMVIDPINTSNIYAGSYYDDFWRSNDAGATATSSVPVPLPGVGALILAVDPSNPTAIYLGSSGGKGIYKSTDSGATWKPLTVQ